MPTQPFRIPETPDYAGFARQNAMLDFSPINNAVSGWQQQQQRDVENKRAEDQLGFQRDRLGMDKQRVSDEKKKNLIESFGNVAMLYDPAKDLDGAQWTGIVKGYDAKMRAHDPSFQGSTPDYYDRVQGPKLILGDSKMAAQQLEYEMRKKAEGRAGAQLGIAQNQEARAKAIHDANMTQDVMLPYADKLNVASRYFTPEEQVQGNDRYEQFLSTGKVPPREKDEIKEFVSSLVRRAITPPAPPTPPTGLQPGQPRLQQQSMEGAPQGDPNLVRVQAPPGQPPPQAAPGVGSIFDGQTPQEKRRIGEALLLDPRTKALGEQLMKDTDKDLTQLGKPASNDIDEKIVAGLDQLARLEGMNQTFDDKYQTIGTRLGMAGAGWMAKIDPSRVDPKTAQDLAAFAKDRRRGVENLNLTIKEITGAAMSNPEAARIMQQVPNPGTGIFDGDDPITYRAKMKDSMDQTRLAVARRAWLKKNNPELLARLSANKMEGVENVMPLDRMRDTMNQRKNEIYQELKQQNPNASREQLIPFVGQRLNQEFGI